MVLQSTVTILVLMGGMIAIVALGLVWQKFMAKPVKRHPRAGRRHDGPSGA